MTTFQKAVPDGGGGNLPMAVRMGRSLASPLTADSLPLSQKPNSARFSLELITLAWVFGSVFFNVTAGSPTTQFMRSLNASNFQFGLMASMPFLASLLSLPASVLTERFGNRKRIFLLGNYVGRCTWMLMALVPMWIVSRHGLAAGSSRAMMIFLGLAFLMQAGGAMGGPAWVSWMADVVPARTQGRYFARRRMWGIITAVPTAWLVGWMLDRPAMNGAGDPMVILRCSAIVLTCAAVFGIADIAFFQLVPEPRRERKSGATLFRAMREPLRNRQFLYFSLFVGMLTFALSCTNQFTTLYLKDVVYVGARASSFNTGAQLMLLVSPLLAQLIVLPTWGAASDRVGKRPVMMLIGIALVPTSFAWCLLGPNTVWLGYIVSGIATALWTGVDVLNFNYVAEHAGGQRQGGSAYVAVNTLIVNICGCLGGLVSGLLSQVLRNWSWTPSFTGAKTFTYFDLLFGFSGVVRFAAVMIFLGLLMEPTAKSMGVSLRFIAQSLMHTIRATLGAPVEWLRSRRRRSDEEKLKIAPAIDATEDPRRVAA